MNWISLGRVFTSAAIVVVFLCTGCASATPKLHAVNLRCEYKTDPLGIDVTKPRLSWLLVSDAPAERGQSQSAYEILVAGSRADLDAGKGELWSTGKFKSDETIQIPYAGKPLASEQQAFWKVRVWNGAGQAGEWSEPATWTAGLMEPSDWKAKWIGYDAKANDDASTPEEKALTFDGLKWIWADEGDPTKDAPVGDRYFAKSISLPPGGAIRKALFLVSVDDHLDLFVNGKGAGEGADFHTAQTLDVTTLLHGGENTLAIKGHNAAGPAGISGRLMVWFVDTKQPATFNIDNTWRVSKTAPKGWPTMVDDFSKWPAAKELIAVGQGIWGKPQKTHLTLPPPPYLRKTFTADRAIKRALVHATALGLYELHLNGERVGKDYFTPGWTDYRKRVYYNTYDVTKLIKPGNNTLGAILGEGWYAGYFAWGEQHNWYGKNPRLMVQLDIEYADGSRATVVTDDSWKCAYGPVTEADLIMGTSYDATKEIPGWDGDAFDDANWQPPVVSGAGDAPVFSPDKQGQVAHGKIKISAYPGDPIRTQEEIKPLTISEPTPGVYVFDLGQNMVGWARFKLNATKGQALTFRYSEMLTPQGTPYTVPLRGARVTDHYIAKGGGEETWSPIFTSHGFRYVEIAGLKDKPSLDAVTGVVAHADIPRTGYFQSSDEAVNKLFHNIIWGQKGNYTDVPTDCPQRDERLGWTGDAQFFVPTAAYNFEVDAFFTKWLVDLDTDAQYPDGSFADVAPDLTGGHGNVAWGDAGVVCPYTMYKRYDDTRIIRAHYDQMARYLDFLTKSSKDFIRNQGAYGDWLNLGGGAKSEVIGTAYYHYIAGLMSEMAGAIGKKEDAKKFEKLSDDIKAAFIKSFVADDGSIKDSSQTGYALAFTMGLIPDNLREKSAEKFVDEIKNKNWHLATGFIGTPRLLPALTDAGRNDVAYRLFLTDTFPSWLYQVKLGSTTMWERWDGWTPDKGFENPAMNSFNHYAFGSVGQWMYQTVGGISTDGAGFRKIRLHPQPGEGLTFAKTRYASIRGEIASEWKKDGDAMTYTFTVPVNTTATIELAAKDAQDITESGKPAREAAGVKFLRSENGAAVFEVQSGTYQFRVR